MIEGMDAEQILTNGIGFVLFIWLLKKTQSNSEKREEKLMEHIEKYDESLDKIASTMESFDRRLESIEDSIRLNRGRHYEDRKR